MANAKKTARPKDAELRRWCIEQASRWPVEARSAYAAQGLGGVVHYGDTDLIGRAEKIFAWVTKA